MPADQVTRGVAYFHGCYFAGDDLLGNRSGSPAGACGGMDPQGELVEGEGPLGASGHRAEGSAPPFAALSSVATDRTLLRGLKIISADSAPQSGSLMFTTRTGSFSGEDFSWPTTPPSSMS